MPTSIPETSLSGKLLCRAVRTWVGYTLHTQTFGPTPSHQLTCSMFPRKINRLARDAQLLLARQLIYVFFFQLTNVKIFLERILLVVVDGNNKKRQSQSSVSYVFGEREIWERERESDEFPLHSDELCPTVNQTSTSDSKENFTHNTSDSPSPSLIAECEALALSPSACLRSSAHVFLCAYRSGVSVFRWCRRCRYIHCEHGKLFFQSGCCFPSVNLNYGFRANSQSEQFLPMFASAVGQSQWKFGKINFK